MTHTSDAAWIAAAESCDESIERRKERNGLSEGTASVLAIGFLNQPSSKQWIAARCCAVVIVISPRPPELEMRSLCHAGCDCAFDEHVIVNVHHRSLDHFVIVNVAVVA